MRTVLGLDTATDDTSVAITRGEEVVFETKVRAVDERPRHTESLARSVVEAVQGAGGWSSVDLIAAGIGPGTYTGLRIGLATAKALRMATGCELVGVGTLATLAFGCIEGIGCKEAVAIIDARRGQVFGARYVADPSNGVALVAGPVACDPGELNDLVGGDCVGVGGGAVKYRALLSAHFEIPGDDSDLNLVQGRYVCLLGAKGGTGEPRPEYLREPDAKRWRERDRDQSR